MKAREIMTTDVVVVEETCPIEEAARLLARHHISGLPVLNPKGAIVGMVTEHDIISKRGSLVSDIMSGGVISVTADTELEDVVFLLTNKRIRRVPVMDGEKLVGILSRSDLVRQIAMRWVCSTCGQEVRAVAQPEQCPTCHAPTNVFAHEVDLPGM
jgi:CBS-domain-containing membrane protein